MLSCVLVIVAVVGGGLLAREGLFREDGTAESVLPTGTLQASVPTQILPEEGVEPSPQQGGIPESTETATQTVQEPLTTSIPEATSQPGVEQQQTDAWVEQTLASLTLQQKIGQMLMMGVEGTFITPQTCDFVKALAPGGIVYRTGNVDTPDQMWEYSAALQNCAQAGGVLPLWLSIDHEGQYVNRFQSGVTVFPMAMAFGATGNPQAAYLAAQAAGNELATSGVNMVLGPVADVLTDYDNSVISLRSYGGDAGQVSQFVSQAVSGYRQAGIAPVIKHFPGHGSVAEDTHEQIVVDPSDEAQMSQVHLPPFQAGIQAGAPVVMLSHVAYPAIDPASLPASLSPAVVAYLREQLGFHGIIITDSLGMAAITSTNNNPGDAAVQSVMAGVDMLLVSSNVTTQAAYDSLLAAVGDGRISEEAINGSVRRILTAKRLYGLDKFPTARPEDPTWKANQELAVDVGQAAVSVFSNTAGLVPIPDNVQRILVISPEYDWGFAQALQAQLGAKTRVQSAVFPGPWNGVIEDAGLQQSLLQTANNFDMVIVLTWEAHLHHVNLGDTWQTDLVNGLISAGQPVAVVALKSPTDWLEFPNVPAFLATYGTTSGQIQGAVDVLSGRQSATGSSPLPGLP